MSRYPGAFDQVRQLLVIATEQQRPAYDMKSKRDGCVVERPHIHRQAHFGAQAIAQFKRPARMFL